jgi:hypothetical protein
MQGVLVDHLTAPLLISLRPFFYRRARGRPCALRVGMQSVALYLSCRTSAFETDLRGVGSAIYGSFLLPSARRRDRPRTPRNRRC